MAITKDGIEYNLLAPIGYETVSNVIGIQNRVLRLMSGGIRSSAIREQTLSDRIKEAEIEKLEELADEMRKSEQHFYNSIGTSFSEIYTKSQEWKQKGASRILKNDDLVNQIKKKLEEYIRTDFVKVVETFSEVHMTKEMLLEIFSEELEEVDSLLEDTIFENIVAGQKSSSGSRAGTIFIQLKRKRASASGKKSYTKLKKIKGITFFESGRVDKEGNSIVEIHFTTDMPRRIQDEITKIMTKLIKDQGVEAQLTSKSDINRAIGDIILSYFPEARYPEARSVISKTINDFLVDTQKINVENNTATIRGMLGEVYWTAFFEFLDLKHRAIPIGFDIKDVHGWEIPTDLLYESFGFQVKNYRVTDGVVSFNSHFDRELTEMVPEETSLRNLLGNRMNLGEDGVEAFGQYFYSYGYNKRNIEIDVNARYVPIEKRFENINHGFKSYVEANKAELLAMDRFVELKDAPAFVPNDFNPGRPTLFLINDRPYPASEMVENIMEGLRGTEEIVTIKVNNLSIDTSPFNTQNKWPDKEEQPDIDKLMTAAKVLYKVDVKIDRLFEYILQRAST